MKAALVILKPRRIEVTERAFAELPAWFPRVELVGYTENELADGAFAEALARCPADFYMVASDDLIVRWPAIAAILTRMNPETVTTGYCQFTHTDWRVNVTRKPLINDQPSQSSYDFYSYHEIVSGPPTQQTWFTGMSLTTMSAAMWRDFPFGCFSSAVNDGGYASDFHLSKRLQEMDVQIDVVREAFAYHWRFEQRHTNDPRDNRVLVGEVEKEIRVR